MSDTLKDELLYYLGSLMYYYQYSNCYFTKENIYSKIISVCQLLDMHPRCFVT